MRLEDAAAKFILAQQSQARARYGLSVDKSLRTKKRWERRWEDALRPTWPSPAGVDLDPLIKAARRDWRRVPEDWKVLDPDRLEKATVRDIFRLFGRLAMALRSMFSTQQGSQVVYLSLAEDTAEDSGQHSLDVLGLDQTWRWTTVRDLDPNVFAVRGSKVIQQAYGTHRSELAKIIIESTDPARPRTQGETRREIRKKWDLLTRSQVERIARTETANVWEDTNLATQVANGVEQFDWLIAKGPSIGPPTSLPVCKDCLRMAAGGPYDLEHVVRPPKHPNCRCTLIPSLHRPAALWLPPAEPWHGAEPPLPTVPA